MAISPWRNARAAAQPPAARANTTSTTNPLSRLVIDVCVPSASVSRATQSNRLPAPAVEIFHLDRFDADPHDAVSAFDDIPFSAVDGRAAAVAQNGNPLRLTAFHQSDELVRNRRRRRGR